MNPISRRWLWSLLTASVVGLGSAPIPQRAAEAVFQSNPTVVTLPDVIACLVLFQNPGVTLSAEQIAAGMSSILGQIIPSGSLNPVPTAALCNFVNGGQAGLELADVIAMLVVFQNPGVTLTPTQLISGVNSILGSSLPATAVLQVPGSPSPNPGLSEVVNTPADNDPTGTNPATCTLREAVVASNSPNKTFGGCLVANNTIAFAETLAGQTLVVTNSALPVITSNVTIRGLGANRLTLSGNNQFRVFEIAEAGSPVVTIQDLRITQGRATNGNGGGILSNSQGLLTLENVTLSNNTATGTGETGRGGGMRACQATVRNSTITGNSAQIRGGGIFGCTITVSNSTLSSNRASYGGGMGGSTAVVTNSTVTNNTASGVPLESRGGGIRFDDLTLENSVISSNTAENRGGGISAATATITNSTITANTVTGGSGGGILADTGTIVNSTLSGNRAGNRGGGASSNGTLSFQNSLIHTNIATYGGGIRVSGSGTAFVRNSIIRDNVATGNLDDSRGGAIIGDAVVESSTISGNRADNRGGAIAGDSIRITNSTIARNTATSRAGAFSSGSALITNSTIVLNQANEGGSIRKFGNAPFVLNNTILAGNTSSTGEVFLTTDAVNITGSNNLVGVGNTGGLVNGSNGNITGISTINTILNTALAANGSSILAGDPNTGQEPVLTHALVSGSLAINSGSNSLIPSGVTTDQRGLPRIVGGTVDRGAFEVQ